MCLDGFWLFFANVLINSFICSELLTLFELMLENELRRSQERERTLSVEDRR